MRIQLFCLYLISLIVVISPTIVHAQKSVPPCEKVDSSRMHAIALMADGFDEKIMAQSPQAAAFIKYGEYPVGLYTGLVDITIPIYSIERSGITVPIEFKYHASGIKFDDVSMEVGLGWSLMAGGVVIHSVKGASDGKFPEYVKDVAKIQTSENNAPTQDYVNIREVENGSRDALNYNNSIEKKDGELDLWNYSFLNHSGTYCFPSYESEIELGGPNTMCGLFIPNNGMQALDRYGPMRLRDTEGITYTFGAFDARQDEKYQEWFLTKALAANKTDSVMFVYDNASTLHDIHKPFINYAYVIRTTTYLSHTGQEIEKGDQGGVFEALSKPPRLRRIDFRGGHVEFEYNVINGLETWDLQMIKIFQTALSVPIRTITLQKSKFINGEDRLDRIIFSNSQGNSYNYQFGYNGEPGDIIADDNSKGIDYWGYFNGKYVPFQKRFTPKFEGYDIDGTDRSPDEEIMQKGILNKVVYPTKGYTEFIYEAHKSNSKFRGPKIFGGLRIKEIRNYLPDNTLAEKRYYRYGENESGCGISLDYPAAEDFLVVSRILETDGSDCEPWRNLEPIVQTDIARYLSFPKRNKLISGSPVVYSQVTEYVGSDAGDCGKTVYNYEVFPNEEMYSQGTTYRANSADISLRDFSWKTGNLKSKKVYKKEGGVYHCIYSVENNYKDINTAEYLNLRASQYVSFTFYPETGFPYQDVMKNFSRLPKYNIHFGGAGTDNTPYDYFNYYTTTGQRVLDSSVEITDGVVKETEYTYNKYGFPVSISMKNNVGDIQLTVNKYPTDDPGCRAMAERNMLSPLIEQRLTANGQPVSRNSVVYSNSKSTNSDMFAPEIRTIESYSQISAQPHTASYHKYDSFGNLLYMTRADGVNVVYLWSYNSVYPVIQVENATYQAVVAALGMPGLKLLSAKNPSDMDLQSCAGQLRDVLSDSYVTLHTYRPLIGVSSVTDPSGRKILYEYDSFGRLIEIADEDGNVLQSYEYNYRK